MAMYHLPVHVLYTEQLSRRVQELGFFSQTSMSVGDKPLF